MKQFTMIKKLIEKAKQPKKPISLKVLLGFLLAQACLLLITLLVVVFWPERAPAVGTFVFMALGISVVLWFDIREAGIKRPSI